MKPAIFLARRSYRIRRTRDLGRMLPFVGIFLLLLPMLWGKADSDTRVTTSDGIYLFVAWLVLILAAALLARALREEPGVKDES